MEGIRREIAGLLPRIATFFSIELGLIKFFTHYFSIYKLDVLDYIVAIGAIIGGLFVFAKKGWQWFCQ